MNDIRFFLFEKGALVPQTFDIRFAFDGDEGIGGHVKAFERIGKFGRGIGVAGNRRRKR